MQIKFWTFWKKDDPQSWCILEIKETELEKIYLSDIQILKTVC